MPVNPHKCEWGCCTIAQRYLLSFLLFASIVMLYNHRVCMNLLINRMVYKKVIHYKDLPDHVKKEYCPRDEKVSNKTKKDPNKRNWTESQQSFVRCSFYIGYVASHLPGGFAADKYGGRIVLIVSLIVSSAFTIIVPFITKGGGWVAVGISRIIVGLAQGVLFPAVGNLLSHWVPKKERAFLGSFAMSGSHVGTITGTAVSGMLTWMTGDWTISFYFWSVSTLVFTIFVFIYVWKDPQHHPLITDEEREMLEAEIVHKEHPSIPFVAIITDNVVWAQAIGQFGHAWVFFSFNTDLPKYLDEVLGFNIKNNGFISALPSLGMWISSILASLLSDYLYRHELCSILNLRRWSTTLGNMIPSFLAIAAVYSGCNVPLAVTLLTLVLTTKGPFYCGVKVNYLDITNNFGGIVNAVLNGFGGIAGILTPIVISAMAPEHTLSEWRRIFWVALVVSAVTTVYYFIFTAAERRSWDYVE